jgi:hypothetical protein
VDLVINLVAGHGVPPLRFGMSIAEAHDALREWGTPVGATGPGRGLPRLRVRDAVLTRDIFALFELGDERLSAVEVWRPEEGDDTVTVRFAEIDVFAAPAEDVIHQLEGRGFAIDQSDPFFPKCYRVMLAFNRDGGDDRDDRGLSRYFESVTIAPPEYWRPS